MAERRKLGRDDFHRMNLPEDLWRVKVKTVPKELRAVVVQYLSQISENVSRGTGMFLSGTPGAGKSSIAALALKEARIQGYTAFFTTVWELREAMRSRVMFDGQSSILDRCRMVDMLVLDDLASGDMKDAFLGGRFFDGLISSRGMKRKPTFLTTRLNNERLRAESPSLLKTLQGFLVFHSVKGPNLRKAEER